MRDYWTAVKRARFVAYRVSVVGFLDEGLLVKKGFRHVFALEVSVVGFLDEGLLGRVSRNVPRNDEVSVVGFLDEGLLELKIFRIHVCMVY